MVVFIISCLYNSCKLFLYQYPLMSNENLHYTMIKFVQFLFLLFPPSSIIVYYLWASKVAQFWRICLKCRRCRFDPWVRKILWRRKWQPTPVFLPGKSHGRRGLLYYSPCGLNSNPATKQQQHVICIGVYLYVTLYNIFPLFATFKWFYWRSASKDKKINVIAKLQHYWSSNTTVDLIWFK